jgi:histidine kinase/DNA gyrase B/HSP90-like ATPase
MIGRIMEQTKATFTVSPRILDHLGISAYNSIQKCLAELVANSHDADSSTVTVTMPDAITAGAAIKITDNGLGMSAKDLADKFLHIGRSRRDEGERTGDGRLIIGSKGIGKLAGFGVASRIRITTRQGQAQSILAIDKEDLESIEELEKHEFDIATTATEQGPGTTIELLGLHEGLHLPPADVIRRYLFRSLPVGRSFSITVNDIECTPEDIHGEKFDFSENIANVGFVSGFYVVANARQPNPGLAVRVRGRIVQESSLFGLDTRAHGFFTAEKLAGEINAEFLDPETSSGDHHDLIKTSRDGLIEDAGTVKALNDWAAAFVKKTVQGLDKTAAKTRTDSLMKAPEIKKRLDALPPHVRGTASKVVKGIIAKLSTASDEDAKNLIEWVLRYYESNVLKELMNAIATADIKEAEKLGEIINEWGLAQLNNVAGIVETQISIITRLEEMVASDAAFEIELHKLIEGNLWLVKEGLELWSSDKPLKTLLDKEIDKVYKDRENIRPDLVCRSRDGGNAAVILEFKRPREKIVMEHVTQALEYEGIIRANRPSIQFTTYLVGREYHPSVLAIKDKQAQAGLLLWSFEEILQVARARFEEVLVILGR